MAPDPRRGSRRGGRGRSPKTNRSIRLPNQPDRRSRPNPHPSDRGPCAARPAVFKKNKFFFSAARFGPSSHFGSPIFGPLPLAARGTGAATPLRMRRADRILTEGPSALCGVELLALLLEPKDERFPTRLLTGGLLALARATPGELLCTTSMSARHALRLLAALE